ncbi:hypothetical protein [Vibrio crassostreae]|uniref:hypothetical protein n=1 Tax=Vibrio crassostreae TaxID=246167 RepID=UPI001B303C99|nr:hypothetical protein [Vibrio crassostreae]
MDCCAETLARYIVAKSYQIAQNVEHTEIARKMLNDAFISMRDEDYAKIILNMGEKYVVFVSHLTKRNA